MPMDKLTPGMTHTEEFSGTTVNWKKMLFMDLQHEVVQSYELKSKCSKGLLK